MTQILKIKKIAVIGQGYVGLPLAIELAKFYPVIGFDIDLKRVAELNSIKDHTLEADIEDLKKVLDIRHRTEFKLGYLSSSSLDDIKHANTYIVTVPTPLNEFNGPELTPLKLASKMLGGILKKGDVVIYESTVYPGCTEEICVPILEAESELKFNEDFFVAYSPERIVPGDKINTLRTIMKVTSGSNAQVADEVDRMYSKIITAGTHKAPSIKVAEASKAIENAQRDVNISFVNELALIFDRVGIDTTDVLEAAGTKFNFLKYKPGLVGGHCISVDPYYLAHKAEQLGYHPQVILSGRRVNDHMPLFVASKVVKLMIAKGHKIKDSNVLILGITFKENCPDIRNTKVADIYSELNQYGLNVDVYDPWASKIEVKDEYNIDLIDIVDENKKYESLIIAVAHKEFNSLNFKKYKFGGSIIYDTKSFVNREFVDGRL
uniref:nucleotide sugar dehydrogenase n=1 Tax=uncultured Polaribacter sp. TaxID=174711 RepID=UPI002620545C|nr:nucleotide sugar dehydrogenase [uncultured Polaribacter sp.]